MTALLLRYTKIKDYMANGDPDAKLSAGRHLLASAESGAITAVMTNPLWVVKTRMFTSRKGGEGAYRDVFGTYTSLPPNSRKALSFWAGWLETERC